MARSFTFDFSDVSLNALHLPENLTLSSDARAAAWFLWQNGAIATVPQKARHGTGQLQRLVMHLL